MAQQAPQAVAEPAVARPFVKWVGGKSHAVDFLKSLLPARIERYYEPMVGGGALFFALAAERRFVWAQINDLNPELMAAYTAVASNVENLISVLQLYRYNRTTFNKLRATDPESLTPLFRAARMIYLNKTCFNGLYRVNKNGQFNVPFGTYAKPTICDAANLRLASKALRGSQHEDFGRVRLTCGTYFDDTGVSSIIGVAGPQDAVYFDPPYVPLSKTSDFTSYGPTGFDLAEHQRLARSFADLAKRGVPVVLSNSDCETTRDLYKGFHIHTLQARRSVNRVTTGRGTVSEIVVTANCPCD